ncbi:molybdopterin synthase [Halohasta litorea]|uniref:Molybdopterin synthase n=1 Tax=Halohasta litorea TaxID=869891 RepID=A0ABD6D469_9EURY|nr:molybdopterin synthase [Halohasta litorea]
MQTLCIIGDGSRSAMEGLADRVAESREGPVATVDHTVESVAAPDDENADGTFRVDGNGRWTGSGTDRSVMGLLDSLAPEYDYAIVAGLAHHRLPTVVIGDAETPPSAEIVASAPTADGLDIASIVDQLDDVEPHITLETLIQRAKASPKADRSGAIATFTGRVRAKDSPEDDRTEHLAFEKYEGVAEDRLDAISQDLTEREGVFEVLLHHRVGRMNDGEDIVFVVVLAGHRSEAFRTVEDGIDRLKAEVPIFKKETTTDEEFWLHER